MEILIRNNPEAGAFTAAGVVVSMMRQREKPVLGLATGNTSLKIYRELIRLHLEEELSFSNCTSFNLDEYVGLPPSDKHSYHKYMQSEFFDHIDNSPKRIHLSDGMASDIRQACRE